MNSIRLFVALSLVYFSSLLMAIEKVATEKSLKEVLGHFYKIDYPISGGYGGTPEDPITLHVSSLADSIKIELDLMHHVMMISRRFWSLDRVELVEEDKDSKLVHYRLKSMRIGEDFSPVSMNFYFKRPSRLNGGEKVFKGYVIHTDSAKKIKYPNEISLLHAVDYHSYEEEHPGMGYSISYKGPDMTATVYVFGGQAKSSLSDQVDEALGDVDQVYGDGTLLEVNQLPDRYNGEMRSFKMKGRKDEKEILFLKAFGGAFLKVRISYPDKNIYQVISDDFLERLMATIEKADQ